MCWELGEVSCPGSPGGWRGPSVPEAWGLALAHVCAQALLPHCYPKDLMSRCLCAHLPCTFRWQAVERVSKQGGSCGFLVCKSVWILESRVWQHQLTLSRGPACAGRFHTDSYNWILSILGHGATDPSSSQGKFQRKGLGHFLLLSPPSSPH